MDAIFIGEMLIDFTPGTEPASYVRNPGGAPANACVAAARNGLSTGFLGKLGNDDFGRFLKAALRAENVAVLCPDLTERAITTLAFVTLYENGERSFTFARRPGADMLLTVDDVDAADISRARLVHAGSFGMSQEPERGATKYALKRAKELNRMVSFDVNYRDTVWESEEACKAEVSAVLPYVDFLKISEEELYFVGGEDNIQPLMEKNHITVIVETLGSEGARYFYAGKEGCVSGHKVKAVDATGAGDAFWGGFISRILMETSVNAAEDVTEPLVRKALEYGNASGAICVQKKGGIPAMPVRAETEMFLKKNQ